MESYLTALANGQAIGWGRDVQPFATGVAFALPNIDVEIYFDLEQFIDVDAELERLAKLQERLSKQIAGKQAKLSNDKFVQRAPAEIVQQERESLQELEQQVADNQQKIDALQNRG